MAATERIAMTMRELDRFKVIQDVADGKLKPWRAAGGLALTTRQIRWHVTRLRKHGPAALVSSHRSRPGNCRLDARVADRAITILRDRYADFGPTLELAAIKRPIFRELVANESRAFQSNIWADLLYGV
jgi:hypothetical protein